jgi:hypothetical protein
VAVSTLGPDLVIAGAARSGTTSLAGQLGVHPDIDPGNIKESNYFSREFDQGPEWYDALYDERRDGLLRMDASTSYTSPDFPEALQRLAKASPDVLVIYSVRQPTERALSHYLLRHKFFAIEAATEFGTALQATTLYEDFSDYGRWLEALGKTFPAEQILVVPFEMITSNPGDITGEICRHLGLPGLPQAEKAARRQRNDVVQYRSEAARQVARTVRRNRAYPWMRRAVGASGARKARDFLTRKPHLPSLSEAMATCSPEQVERLRRLDERAGAAARAYLLAQDARLGLSWAEQSFAVLEAGPATH